MWVQQGVSGCDPVPEGRASAVRSVCSAIALPPTSTQTTTRPRVHHPRHNLSPTPTTHHPHTHNRPLLFFLHSTKLAWIREATLALNPSDPGLRGHVRPVLEQVAAALQRCAGEAKGADASACKLAMHVVRSQLVV